MTTLLNGTGLTVPPYQFNLGGGGYGDLGSISNYSTQGASMFGGMGTGGLGLNLSGAQAPAVGGLAGIGGRGPITTSGAGSDSILGGLGMNIPTLQLGLGLLSSLGGIYGATQANSLARDQFKFGREVTNTNLTNQIQSYNTALEDRARTRAVQENRSEQSAQDYIDRNRLNR